MRTTPASAGRRVLIIVQNLPVPFDRRVWQEARALKAQGYQVAVICPTGRGFSARYECLEGIHIYRHPLPLEARGALGYALEYACSLFWELVLSVKVLRRHGFDAIHACNPPDNIFLIGALYKALARKRFLFDHHDINPELFEAKFGRRGLLYWLVRLAERLTFLVADVSIATNESYRQIALERGRMAPEKVFVVRSGPSLERLRILPPAPQCKRGRKYLVGYVGVMGAQEGIPYLIEAARHIVRERGREDVHFVLVGGGPALEDMRRLTSQQGLDPYVEFLGRVPDEKLLEVLNSADVCVNCDEVNPMNDKSTMNKIMEYMALGKPIVQFELTEGRFSAREASLYAKPNDARDFADKIVTLLDDPERRQRMGQFGRHRVERQLAWDYEVPKLLAAYEALFAPVDGIPTLGAADFSAPLRPPAGAGARQPGATRAGYSRGYRPQTRRSSPPP
ncbi:MAG TPA: glycosyltransferase family 4 protein [Steroidobacteraceae bacterium]|nr:glycosyltransferase family 4 protein [Steroidobacteraceae bacterium]